MKTATIIKERKEVKKELLTCMYEMICKQKELLELLLLENEEEDPAIMSQDEEVRNLIKGIDGLAKFLGCGLTKAQSIMNSGILQQRDIAYRAGNRWRFNEALLKRLLKEEPDILNGV